MKFKNMNFVAKESHNCWALDYIMFVTIMVNYISGKALPLTEVSSGSSTPVKIPLRSPKIVAISSKSISGQGLKRYLLIITVGKTVHTLEEILIHPFLQKKIMLWKLYFSHNSF